MAGTALVVASSTGRATTQGRPGRSHSRRCVLAWSIICGLLFSSSPRNMAADVSMKTWRRAGRFGARFYITRRISRIAYTEGSRLEAAALRLDEHDCLWDALIKTRYQNYPRGDRGRNLLFIFDFVIRG
jgi:hypothetical protein